MSKEWPGMQEFRIKADATFLAEDIDDAMAYLASHFLTMIVDGVYEESNRMQSGQILVEPVNTKP